MSDIGNYEVESMLRSYHAYRDVLEATVGQTLPC